MTVNLFEANVYRAANPDLVSVNGRYLFLDLINIKL